MSDRDWTFQCMNYFPRGLYSFFKLRKFRKRKVFPLLCCPRSAKPLRDNGASSLLSIALHCAALHGTAKQMPFQEAQKQKYPNLSPPTSDVLSKALQVRGRFASSSRLMTRQRKWRSSYPPTTQPSISGSLLVASTLPLNF